MGCLPFIIATILTVFVASLGGSSAAIQLFVFISVFIICGIIEYSVKNQKNKEPKPNTNYLDRDNVNPINDSEKNIIKLINCPACNRELSPAAEFCPGCGHPLKTKKNEVERDLQQNEKILCPTCKSPNISKISATHKATSAVLWGLFSMGTLTKTFECNKCGYRW